MLNEILPLIPYYQETTQYVEPFFGGGAVFFAKNKHNTEVINDLDNRVVNFYLCLKNKFNELKPLIDGTLHAEIINRETKKIINSDACQNCKKACNDLIDVWCGMTNGGCVQLAYAFWAQCNISFVCLFRLSMFSEVIYRDFVSVKENEITYMAKRVKGDNNISKILIKKIIDDKAIVVSDFFDAPLKNIFVDDKNIYFTFFGGEIMLAKTSKDAIGVTNLMQAPMKTSPFYEFDFSMKNNQMITRMVGGNSITDLISKSTFFYINNEELWFPKDNDGNLIYEEARSAIKGWSYDGKLKRWYSKNKTGKTDKNVWIEKTPTQEMLNFMHQLWDRSRNNEEVDYFAEFTKMFKREKENDLLLKSKNNKNIENSKEIQNDNTSNNENDVKNFVETENSKLNKLIILGVLFLVILGAFLIKNHKKKKIINDKNI